MELFRIEKLPEIDQQQIKRGLCPWCMTRLFENENGNDSCPECGDEFIGKLTIED